MSLYAVERVLWELVNDADRIADFREETEKYLQPYQLSAEEKKLLETSDYEAMKAAGVNDRLIFAAKIALDGKESDLQAAH